MDASVESELDAGLDLEEDEGAERMDIAPGSDIGDLAGDETRHRRRLLDMARQAEEILGLAEDRKLVGFTGAPESAQWIADDAAETLLRATPDANISPDQARDSVARVIAGHNHLKSHLDEVAIAHGQALLDAHRRVRQAAGLKAKNVKYEIEPTLPPFVLGVYLYLPAGGVGKHEADSRKKEEAESRTSGVESKK